MNIRKPFFLILVACILLSGCGTYTENETAMDADDSGTAKGSVDTAKTPRTYQTGELIAMARAYYEEQSGFRAPEADCTENTDGTYTLHLYEKVDNGDGTYHTATSAWYTVSADGTGFNQITGEEVRLKELLPADLAANIGTPVKLLYIQDGEARNEWKIEDPEFITECLEALKQIEIGQPTELRACDAGENLIFELKDGSKYSVYFENGNLLKDGICYETEGYAKINGILRTYLYEQGRL